MGGSNFGSTTKLQTYLLRSIAGVTMIGSQVSRYSQFNLVHLFTNKIHRRRLQDWPGDGQNPYQCRRLWQHGASRLLAR